MAPNSGEACCWLEPRIATLRIGVARWRLLVSSKCFCEIAYLCGFAAKHLEGLEFGARPGQEGTVCQDNNLLHITSRVVNAVDGFQIWSERVETEANMQGLFKICERIADSLMSRIRQTTA